MRPTTRSLRTHPIVRLLAGFLPLAFFISGCSGTYRCKPTATTPRPAATVDATEPASSHVLWARLTTKGNPMTGRSLNFSIRSRDRTYGLGAAKTNKDGWASFDLTNEFVKYPEVLLSDRFWAWFDGNKTYCASLGDAAYHAAQAPVVGAVDLPPLPVPIEAQPRSLPLESPRIGSPPATPHCLNALPVCLPDLLAA